MTDGTIPGGNRGSALAYLPAAWVAVVVLLDLRGLFATLPVIGQYDFSNAVMLFVYANTAFSAVNVVWGILLLGLAYKRSVRFAWHFTVWQVVNIVWLVVTEAYVHLVADFGFSLEASAMKAVMLSVGLFCLWLVRRGGTADAVFSTAAGARPSAVVVLLASVLGVTLGGALGAAAGIGVGTVLVDMLDISCFEGGCGYFTILIGLLGLLVGAIAGGVFGAVRVLRRSGSAAPSSAG
jgi:hypothetical protein